MTFAIEIWQLEWNLLGAQNLLMEKKFNLEARCDSSFNFDHTVTFRYKSEELWQSQTIFLLVGLIGFVVCIKVSIMEVSSFPSTFLRDSFSQYKDKQNRFLGQSIRCNVIPCLWIKIWSKTCINLNQFSSVVTCTI